MCDIPDISCCASDILEVICWDSNEEMKPQSVRFPMRICETAPEPPDIVETCRWETQTYYHNWDTYMRRYKKKLQCELIGMMGLFVTSSWPILSWSNFWNWISFKSFTLCKKTVGLCCSFKTREVSIILLLFLLPGISPSDMWNNFLTPPSRGEGGEQESSYLVLS